VGYTDKQVNSILEERKMAKATWFWTLIGFGVRVTGEVQAVDPRDAVSRAITSTASDGRLYGKTLGIPLEFIDAAPGNADGFFEVANGSKYVVVRRKDQPATRARTMLELKVLWEALGDIPVSGESDSIGVQFFDFAAGTPREDIWRWFESQTPQFVVGDVMAGIWPE
jgi:hypothetical protein